MSPIQFSESNFTLGKPVSMTDEECQPLPVFRDGTQCISCWKPTWHERLSILLHGRVWVFVIMGNTQPPIAISGEKTVFVQANKGRRWNFRFPRRA